jgi:hypothetical protein
MLLALGKSSLWVVRCFIEEIWVQQVTTRSSRSNSRLNEPKGGVPDL